jgi:hypothetical protein
MLHDLWASVYKDYVESKGHSSELFGCVTSKPRNRRDCDEIWELDIYGLMTVEETRAGICYITIHWGLVIGICTGSAWRTLAKQEVLLRIGPLAKLGR